MSLKTKNLLRNIGFLLSVPILIGAFVFSVNYDKGAPVDSVEVSISNPELGFVSNQDIQRSLQNEDIILKHTPLDQLDVTALEEKINSNPWVKHADVFVSSDRKIKVNLAQVVPKVRVQRTDSTANGYYLDESGTMIPLNANFAADLPIVTIEKRVSDLKQRQELVQFAQYIEKDTFWQAAISQINLDKNNELELVSLIGNANIRFGTTENKEDKFFRLFQFYKKGINRINWNNVKELDLRFDKQLVCRRYHKEKHIEERKAPSLYVKTKRQTPPKPIEKIAKRPKKPVAEKRVAKQSVDVPVRRKVVKKNVWKHDEETGDRLQARTTKKKKTKRKKAVVSSSNTSKKRTSKSSTRKKATKKKVVKKTTTKAKKPVKRTVAKKKSTPAKARTKNKRKREIIINTEPVTKK
jgi:cell division protein FtsQ